MSDTKLPALLECETSKHAELSKRTHSLDEFYVRAFLADLTNHIAHEGNVDGQTFKALLELREMGQEAQEAQERKQERMKLIKNLRIKDETDLKLIVVGGAK